ncbi:MAG: TIGR03619 family F420-dependent LLM class oxidoreductase [Acidimicrobiia bacterium]
MRIGISLPQCGVLAHPDHIRTVARTAEHAGFASVWVLDQILRPVEPGRVDHGHAGHDGAFADGPLVDGGCLDPIGVLTLAAAVTDRIRLGTSVLVAPLYPPVLLARTLATLDRISGGRLDVGLGLGWSVDEYDAVAVPMRERAARLDETLDVLEGAWRGEPVECHGPHAHVATSRIEPSPVQPGGPPILLSAYTPSGFDRVATRASGWNPAGLPVQFLAPMWASIRERAEAQGRHPDDLELVVRANIRVTDRPIDRCDRPTYWGSIEQIARDIEATVAVGADEIILGVQHDPASADELFELLDRLVDRADLRAELRAGAMR